METVSSIYLEGMGNMVRKPSRMRLTFHYVPGDSTGDIVYNNADIVKVTEKKTAHLIAGELPAVELEMELVNLDGSFNPNDISGLHDLIVKGVPVTYEFGYDIPNLQYYGYTDGAEHDYGMEENVPYGFMEGYATEWIPGGEVFTSGEISYSKTTATISAKDYLSFLDEHVLLAYGNRTLAQVAKDVLSLTDYPKEDDGDPKIITGPELDAFNTAITLSETEDESISAKEHLQTIAHACGVQMYIDRGGYIHLDNDKRGVSAVYSLPLGQQGEQPEHRKEQMPKKVVITLNSEYGDPVETDLNGGGETMTVENPFIVTTAEGETLRGIVYDHFIKYRNTADVPYRGEPALDILDTIALGTEFGGDVEAIVVGTELEFDGTLSGSLSVRYQLGGNTPEKVQIKGSGNFIYPLGEDDEPSITSFNLLCETTFPTPTYQWSYFTVSNGSWLNIAGATSNTLTVAYDSSYYDNDSSVKFRCVVNNTKGAITQISKIQLQKSETAGYRGVQRKATKDEIDVPSPQIGDVVLLDNTKNANASVYGEAHIYDGEKWVATEESDALAMTYKDALELAELSEKTIYASKIFTDLLVANEAFIGKLFTNQIKLSEDGSIASEDFAEDEKGIPTSGFKFDNPLTPFGRRGRVRAHGGIFDNTTIYGSIIHDALVTRKSAPTTPVTFPSKTAWNRKDFWNALSVTENSADMIATVLDIAGTTYTYLRKITSASYIKTLLAYQALPVPSEWTEYVTYTIQGKGFADWSGKVATFIIEGYPYQSRIQIQKNGVLIKDYYRKTEGTTTFSESITVEKGDTLSWRFAGDALCELGLNWRGIQNSLQVSNETTSWDTIEGMASDYLARGSWQCSSPITFDSNINLASANAFIAGFSDLPEGVEIETDDATSIVTYGALSNEPVSSVINYGSSIRLNYSGGYVTFVAGSDADGSFTGWYNATASISVLSKEGIVVSNIIPKDNTRELGEFDNPFQKGYFEQVVADLVDADAINLGTPSLSANGYTDLPNGMRMQWMSLSLGSDTADKWVTFPIAFATTCVFASVVSNWTATTGYGWDYVRDISKTGCRVVATQGNPRLLAIGY